MFNKKGRTLPIGTLGEESDWDPRVSPGPAALSPEKGREIQKFGVQKMKKIQILKIQIRSAQNVGKVWISRAQKLSTLFHAISGIFPWTEHMQKLKLFSRIFSVIHTFWKALAAIQPW